MLSRVRCNSKIFGIKYCLALHVRGFFLENRNCHMVAKDYRLSIPRRTIIQPLLLPAGVSYFVFNETLDVYSGTDENVKKFQTAGIEFIESLSMIAGALPLYRLYPTKSYRHYLQKLNAVQDLG